jgi:aspartyl-tRNA(Asn)/glutamyl-tRNA(Gln) amidotransferase subunit A
MTNGEICYSGIAEISAKIKNGEISPVSLVENSLRRIKRYNSTLNTFITVLEQEALVQAKEADATIRSGNWMSTLHGIPVAVKDFYDTKGIRTTAGFEHFKDRIPQEDAVVVKKLKEAGAIIIGKTNMHQLGTGTTGVNSFFGAIHNPWDTAYAAGGSSGGSAAAVASGMCYATVDTDAVGSCRLPASCCGVTGFKPGFGIIDTTGILSGEKADDTILKLAHAAITARSAYDANIVFQLLTDRISKNLPGIQSLVPTGLRISLVENYTASTTVREVFEKMVDELITAGFDVETFPIPFDAAVFSISTIDKDRAEVMRTVFQDVDILLLPTVTASTPSLEEARRGGEQAISPANTFFANYFGIPAISIPGGFDEHGLPVGLQIMGAPSEE